MCTYQTLAPFSLCFHVEAFVSLFLFLAFEVYSFRLPWYPASLPLVSLKFGKTAFSFIIKHVLFFSFSFTHLLKFASIGQFSPNWSPFLLLQLKKMIYSSLLFVSVTWSIIAWDKDLAFWIIFLVKHPAYIQGFTNYRWSTTRALVSGNSREWMGKRLESLNRLCPFPPDQWFNLAQGNSKQTSKWEMACRKTQRGEKKRKGVHLNLISIYYILSTLGQG